MPATEENSARNWPGRRIVAPTAMEVARQLADRLTEHLSRRLSKVPVAHIALSGGSSAKLLGAAFAEKGALSAAHWSRIHVWMVDERCVATDDPRLNCNLIRNTLVAHGPLPGTNLHPMPVLEADGARRYEAELEIALTARPEATDRCLDAVVLGMGPDGHTASLFPGSPALDERDRLVVLNDGDAVVPPRPRMTMTYPLLNRALLIALLVTVASKRPALQRLREGRSDFHSLPVVGIVPSPGSQLLWYLDREAVE